MAQVLERTTFQTSREMDFFSEKELTTQTGHGIQEWPLVVIKELTDNALDACEQADVTPVIHIACDAGGITVQDNGPGLPEATLAGALDFTVRASNREAYVAPDRGAQGNALMTILSMPFVVDPGDGCLVVETGGVRHRIICRADPITQRAIVEDETESIPEVPGTVIRVQWSENHNDKHEIVWPFDDMTVVPGPKTLWWAREIKLRVLAMVRGYALFNPHLTISLDWFGEQTHFDATNTAWKKWKPNQPTSPHWYGQSHLERLIAAYVTHDRDHGTDRTIAEFVSEFDGLSGSRKRKSVLDEAGLQRTCLSFLTEGGTFNQEAIAKLLQAMQAHTKPVKPSRLGVIGKDHISERLKELGGDPEQITYDKTAREEEGLPYVLEVAFAWLGDDAPDQRQVFAGANWSAAINNPFRSFGRAGQGLEGLLSDQFADAEQPVLFLVHLAHPRVEYADRGKSAIVLKSGNKEVQA
ncbi:hypothetical protein [Symmachiella dynata]|uniref:hypothetical protein n=1 Tax=Symmachiella dynata TaxID=2527995 RepID=UPI0011A6F304|nr:hypothetical protein [Symmachiella dynata]